MGISAYEHLNQDFSTPVGLRQEVAQTLPQTLAAWGLVYRSYLAAGLIQSNEQEIYYCPEALSSHTAVMTANIGSLTVSTLTAIVDHGQGLPIQNVFAEELAELDQQNEKIMQVGMFADRRRLLSRCDESLLDLMRMSFYFGLHRGATALVIGVSPDHVPFYTNAFGLKQIGKMREYVTLNHTPVVLLAGPIQAGEAVAGQPPAIRYFLGNPIAPDFFDHIFDFAPAKLTGSPLGGETASISQTGMGMGVS